MRVLSIASALGIYGVFESFVLYWIVGRDYFDLPGTVLQATIFLKLLVSGHMTMMWERPWPNWKPVVTCARRRSFLVP